MERSVFLVVLLPLVGAKFYRWKLEAVRGSDEAVPVAKRLKVAFGLFVLGVLGILIHDSVTAIREGESFAPIALSLAATSVVILAAGVFGMRGIDKLAATPAIPSSATPTKPRPLRIALFWIAVLAAPLLLTSSC